MGACCGKEEVFTGTDTPEFQNLMKKYRMIESDIQVRAV